MAADNGQLLARILMPPEYVVDVETYKSYILSVFADGASTTRPVGRPKIYGHPCYKDHEYRLIQAAIMADQKVDPDVYRNKEGKGFRGFAKDQPNDELTFHLDNGMKCIIAMRPEFGADKSFQGVDGIHIHFPPGCIE